MKRLLIIISSAVMILTFIGISSKKVEAQTSSIVNFNVGITGTANEPKYNELLYLYNEGFDRLNYIELDGVDATIEFSLAQITVYQVYDADSFSYLNEIRISQSNNIILRVSEKNYIFNSELANNQVQITLALSDRYYEGFEDARSEYGIYYNGQWLTAQEYGTIQYDYGYDTGYDWGYDYGYDLGYDYGFDDGAVEQDTTYKGVFSIITNAIFTPIALIFGIEILPNISLGMIILVPLLFGLIAFVVGGKKK